MTDSADGRTFSFCKQMLARKRCTTKTVIGLKPFVRAGLANAGGNTHPPVLGAAHQDVNLSFFIFFILFPNVLLVEQGDT